jgi:hypothetical protein
LEAYGKVHGDAATAPASVCDPDSSPAPSGIRHADVALDDPGKTRFIALGNSISGSAPADEVVDESELVDHGGGEDERVQVVAAHALLTAFRA